jgi:hypothetical protein
MAVAVATTLHALARGICMRTLTGCLAKGAKANQYEIADQASKKKVAFPGPAQLDQFINQTVRLIGNLVDDGNGNKVFQPDSVSRVSASC